MGEARSNLARYALLSSEIALACLPAKLWQAGESFSKGKRAGRCARNDKIELLPCRLLNDLTERLVCLRGKGDTPLTLLNVSLTFRIQ